MVEGELSSMRYTYNLFGDIEAKTNIEEWSEPYGTSNVSGFCEGAVVRAVNLTVLPQFAMGDGDAEENVFLWDASSEKPASCLWETSLANVVPEWEKFFVLAWAPPGNSIITALCVLTTRRVETFSVDDCDGEEAGRGEEAGGGVH